MRDRLFSSVPTFGGALWLVVRLTMALVLWAYLISRVADMTVPAGAPDGHSMMYFIPWAYLLPPLAAQLLTEELIRLGPLALVVWLYRRKPDARRPVIAASVATAIVFGLMHLPNGLPLVLVLCCQTLLGFAWNHVWLRTGGWHGRPLVGLWWAFLAHFLYDVALVAIEKTLT